MNHKITPVILAGGLGTRLHSVIADKPKVLAPVNGQPFLSYLLDQLIAAGFQDVILCTGYRGEMVRETFGSHYRRLNIRYSYEPEPLGTGGALRYALPMIDSETILVMNGDSYLDTNLYDFINWYMKRRHETSILLTKMPDTSRYGRIEFDVYGRILRFEEKSEELRGGWISAGTYLLKKSLLEIIRRGVHYSLETEYFPHLVKIGFYGYVCESKFIDIGTPESYEKAHLFFNTLKRGSNS